MKGGKKKNSNSDQIQLDSPPERSGAVNGGSDSAPEDDHDDGGSKREESERFVSADEGLDEDDGGEERDSGADGDDKENEQPDKGERPKLAEGFFEVEDVRGRRIRKGKRQYLIKWRDWPEEANTWEPYENLGVVADVIEKYEQSLKAGKSTRKKKRKASINHVLPKKKQRELRQHSAPPPLKIADELAFRNEVNTNGGTRTDEVVVPKQLGENGVKRVSAVGGEQTELGGEMKTAVQADGRVALPSGASQPTGVETSETGVQMNGEREAVEPGRHIGAKRRKSGSVKRFKKDPVSSSVEIADASLAASAPIIHPSNFHVSNGNSHNEAGDPSRSFTITEIIKPTSYRASSSDGVNDVFLSFEALRSDGRTTTVTNKYLKAKNPLLLIDYYEKNLRYNPTQ